MDMRSKKLNQRQSPGICALPEANIPYKIIADEATERGLQEPGEARPINTLGIPLQCDQKTRNFKQIAAISLQG
jgi:hypothetical protein